MLNQCAHDQGWTSIGVNEMGNWLNCNSCQTTRLKVSEHKAAELKEEKIKLKLIRENAVKEFVIGGGDGLQSQIEKKGE